MQKNDVNLKRLARFGELLVAFLMVYSSVMHFKFAHFVAGIVPKWLPWRLFWAYFTGVGLFAAGVSIVVRKHTYLATMLLAIMLSLFILLIHTPSMINSIVHKSGDIAVLWSFNGTGGVNNALKDVALMLSALIVGCAYSVTRQPVRTKVVRILSTLFALVIVAFGIEHFLFTNYTPGVPSWSFVTFWIPWRLFWGYFTGAAMVVGGVMILVKRKGPIAATALAIMILVVAVLTYGFRVIAHLGNYSELTDSVKDVAVAGGLLVLAAILPSEDQAARDLTTDLEHAEFRGQ